ncbi:hypothetical protein EB796_002748 [Bugula neritina]|uniref:Uncharacterized protein n=1 Tax=Bugula neritina TaxID=10212 RepID=A0A7J7KLH4_BUGNE|nr:hypothetical protein EB796_002748 [Bugula neritina]
MELMSHAVKERNFAKRVRRTYLGIWTRTINGIESGRLDKQLQLLERQKLHTVRLVNNDIRLTRVTLDHIEACSGHSINQLGFLGSSADGSLSNLALAGDESTDKPMFLYGERQVSRRVSRFRRIQSAMGKGRSSSTSSGLPLSDLQNRPKSSIPTFREIRVRVKRQLELKPNWDPNTELPYDSGEEGGKEDVPQKVTNAWESEDRISSAKYTYFSIWETTFYQTGILTLSCPMTLEKKAAKKTSLKKSQMLGNLKTEYHLPSIHTFLFGRQHFQTIIYKVDRTKSGKRSNVSWHLAKSPPASVTEKDSEVITMIEKENTSNRDHGVEANNKINMKNSRITSQRSRSATSKLQSETKLDGNETAEVNQKDESPSLAERKEKVKSASARLERTQNLAPKPRNPPRSSDGKVGCFSVLYPKLNAKIAVLLTAKLVGTL